MNEVTVSEEWKADLMMLQRNIGINTQTNKNKVPFSTNRGTGRREFLDSRKGIFRYYVQKENLFGYQLLSLTFFEPRKFDLGGGY
jgi:hypothetical protein